MRSLETEDIFLEKLWDSQSHLTETPEAEEIDAASRTNRGIVDSRFLREYLRDRFTYPKVDLTPYLIDDNNSQ